MLLASNKWPWMSSGVWYEQLLLLLSQWTDWPKWVHTAVTAKGRYTAGRFRAKQLGTASNCWVEDLMRTENCFCDSVNIAGAITARLGLESSSRFFCTIVSCGAWSDWGKTLSSVFGHSSFPFRNLGNLQWLGDLWKLYALPNTRAMYIGQNCILSPLCLDSGFRTDCLAY